MTSSEKFSLRWNDFQENISSAFGNLRDDTNLTDITLLTEDGQNIEAHKIILSASSPFFMNILKLNKHPNPLVYLKGFKATFLNSILDFMYHGVADIYQENLDGFLALAEELQLKGLTGGTQNHSEENQEKKIKSIPKDDDLKRAVQYYPPTNKKVDNYYDKDVEQTNTLMALDNSAAQVHFSGGSAEDLNLTLWSMIYQNGTVLTCKVCGKSKDKTLDKNANKNMRSHVESLHTEGVVYECNKCDKTFGYKNAFHKHTHQAHNRR